MIYPWQATVWQQLCDYQQYNRLPHAFLLHGMSGIGKSHLADTFCGRLLCQALTTAYPCGECHACRLLAANTHPNILRIIPEKEGHAIKVDQIREVADFVSQTSLQGAYRIVLIHPAEQMNTHAANALLKTLEEPAAGAILMLISNESGRLPATILSRCQRVTFAKPQLELALPWLQKQLTAEADVHLLLALANGAPLAALRLVKDGLLSVRHTLFSTLFALLQRNTDLHAAVTVLQENELLPLIDFSLHFLTDLLHMQLTSKNIVNQDYHEQFKLLQKQVSLQAAVTFLSYLLLLRKQICLGLNFNKQLCLESILLKWQACKQERPGAPAEKGY